MSWWKKWLLYSIQDNRNRHRGTRLSEIVAHIRICWAVMWTSCKETVGVVEGICLTHMENHGQHNTVEFAEFARPCVKTAENMAERTILLGCIGVEPITANLVQTREVEEYENNCKLMIRIHQLDMACTQLLLWQKSQKWNRNQNRAPLLNSRKIEAFQVFSTDKEQKITCRQ